MSDVFDININYADSTLIARGHLDVGAVSTFLDSAKTLIATATNAILIDMSAVKFLDSSGLGALVAAKNAAEMKGLNLSLRNATPRVLELIRMTGLSEVFPTA